MTTRLRPSARALFVALAALLMAAASAADLAAQTNYYVRTNGSNGNDGRANNSSRAWRTIEYALSQIQGGDRLYVANGTYSIPDKLELTNKSGTSANRTLIKSINRWGAKIRFTDKWGTFKITNSDYLTIDGFDIGVTNPAGIDHQGTGLVSFDSDYVTYQNNFVHDCGCNGLSFREGDYVTIQQNVVRDNAKRSNYNCSGISIYQPIERNQNGGFHLIIRRNVAFENECDLPFNIGAGSFDKPTDGNGIILDDFANKQRSDDDPRKNKVFRQGTLVENNLVFNNGGAGVKVFDIDNATIRNNTSYHNLRILKNYSNPPAEIAVTFSPGIFEIHNNVAVARNDAACKALEYSDNYGYGYFNRQSNLVVGAVQMVSNTDQWGASNDLVRDRGQQAYPKFANATTSIGSFSSVNDFDQYFRLQSSSPAHNSGDNGRAAGNDLEGRSRPDGDRVERGCYEGASGTSTPTTTTSNQWAYRENLTGNWRNWSYGGNVTLRDGGIKKNGSYSLKFQSTESWGALSLQHPDGKSGSGLKEIRFWARKWKDNGNYTARFRVRTDNNNGLTWRSFQPTNSFQQFVFSKAQLGNPGTVRRMDINVPNGNTLWVDDLRLVYETTNLTLVELEQDLVDAAAEQAPLTIMPTVNAGVFDVELDVPERVEAVEMALVSTDGRTVDAASLPVLPGRNRLHVDVRRGLLAEGVYLLTFRSADGTFQRAERMVIRR